MEVLRSQRGNPLLCFEGYLYNQKRPTAFSIRWRCSNNRIAVCKGALTTDVKDFANPRSRIPHSHGPDPNAVVVAKVRLTMKDQIVTSGESPGQIVAKAMDNIPNPLRNRLSKTKSIKRALQRHRKVTKPDSDVRRFFEFSNNREETEVPQPAVTPQPAPYHIPVTTRSSVNTPPAKPTSFHDEVYLKWSSYQNNMMTVFRTLFSSQQFVDVTIACEGKSIKCHKVLLSACSDIFSDLLSQNPCKHPIIIMKDIKFWEMQALIDFMYRGEVKVSQEKLPGLLQAAETLQIKGLASSSLSGSVQEEDSQSLYLEDLSPNSSAAVASAAQLRRLRKKRALTVDIRDKTGHFTVSPIITSVQASAQSSFKDKCPEATTSQPAKHRKLMNPTTFKSDIVIKTEPLVIVDTRRETTQISQNSSDIDLACKIKCEPSSSESNKSGSRGTTGNLENHPMCSIEQIMYESQDNSLLPYDIMDDENSLAVDDPLVDTGTCLTMNIPPGNLKMEDAKNSLDINDAQPDDFEESVKPEDAADSGSKSDQQSYWDDNYLVIVDSDNN